MTITEFLAIFQAIAFQLAADDFGRQWHESGIDPRDAARWANIGYAPAEAQREMAAGVTLREAEYIARGRRHVAEIRRKGELVI
jgi:hypothetical protein